MVVGTGGGPPRVQWATTRHAGRNGVACPGRHGTVVSIVHSFSRHLPSSARLSPRRTNNSRHAVIDFGAHRNSFRVSTCMLPAPEQSTSPTTSPRRWLLMNFVATSQHTENVPEYIQDVSHWRRIFTVSALKASVTRSWSLDKTMEGGPRRPSVDVDTFAT